MKKTTKISQPIVPDHERAETNIHSKPVHDMSDKQEKQRLHSIHLHDRVDDIIEEWAHERPDLDVSPLAIINRMGRLSSFFHAEITQVYERFGLTGPSFAVISALRRAGAPYQLSQRELMEILQLTSGTISVRIDRLVQDGFVGRLPEPHDQRGVLVQLTAKALTVFDQMAPVHLANEARLLSALNSEQREQLASLLRILLLSFEPLASEDPQNPLHWFGAALAPAHRARQIRHSVGLPDEIGLLVQMLTASGSAAKAGLQVGDLIVAADQREIRSLETLYECVVAAQEGTLTLHITRGTERLQLQMLISSAKPVES
jgi:DNA-binding MarR family transcriptional regulator